MKSCIFFFLMLVVSFSGFAQEEEFNQSAGTNEFQALEKNLRELYNNGQLEELITTFNAKCLNSEGNETLKFKFVDNDIRADIYYLVSLALIATDHPDLAPKYLKKLFVIKHAKDFSDDWLTIKKEREKYYILPQLTVGVNFGTTYTSALLTTENYVFENTAIDQNSTTTYPNRNKTYDKTYSSLLSQRSYSLGLAIDYRIFRDLNLSFSPTYVSRKFSVSSNFKWDKGFMFGDTFTSDTLRSAEFNVDHVYTLNYFELPIDVKYIYSKWKIRPFVGLGYSYSILNGAQVFESSKKIIVNSDGKTLSYSSSQSFDAADFFESFHSVRGLLGLTYSRGKFFDLTFKVLYQRNISPVVNIKNAYSNASFVWSSYYAMDDFNLQTLRFELTIVAPIVYKAFKKR